MFYLRMLSLLPLLFFLLAFDAKAEEDYLAPEVAFQFSAQMVDTKTAEVTYKIADGYYMYRERFAFAAKGATLGEPAMPKGKIKFDETFQKDVETYRNSITIRLPVDAKGSSFTLKSTSQGCADKGLCYAPMESVATLTPAGSAVDATVKLPQLPSQLPIAALAVAKTVTPPMQDDEQSRIETSLKSGQLLAIVPLFLLLGLGLSFTPCVLPMVPILSFIIAGEGVQVRRSRGFILSAVYALGMAIVYTILGIVAGLIGEGLSATLQNPWVLGTFGLFMVVLALSMFDIYPVQMPVAIQQWLMTLSQKQTAGKLPGVFVMGALSALIVGPCVAAPLAGALVYISQTRDVLIGGSALFSMAVGMSVPLLLVGISAGALLPRAGPWMGAVKKFFGVLMLAMAFWLVSPILPAWMQIDVFNVKRTEFAQIRTSAELDAALARANGKIVMLDFYADWCIACKEMEKLTFPDPRVQAQFKNMVLLQIDVTANNSDDKAMLKRFKLFGPPAIVFFDKQGQEIQGRRVIGYQNADKFLRSLAMLDNL